MPRGQGFWAPSFHVSEMHRALWMQLFQEAGSRVKQWPWPGPFWGAPKPVCCSGGSKAGGFHSYFCGVGRVVNRVAQVKMSQTLVLLLRYSSFSWVNSLQMVVRLWLISSALKKLILIILPVFSWFLWRTRFMVVLTVLSWKACLPQVVSFPFMLWLLHSLWQDDTEEASFLNPLNVDKDSYITLAKYSVCMKMIVIPWEWL